MSTPLYSGDDWAILASFKDENGDVLDISGWTFKYIFVDSGLEEKDKTTFDHDGDDETNGEAVFEYDSDETAEVSSYGDKRLEIQADKGSNGGLETFVINEFTLRRNVIEPQ